MAALERELGDARRRALLIQGGGGGGDEDGTGGGGAAATAAEAEDEAALLIDRLRATCDEVEQLLAGGDGACSAPQAPMDEVDPRVARVRALRGMLCS